MAVPLLSPATSHAFSTASKHLYESPMSHEGRASSQIPVPVQQHASQTFGSLVCLGGFCREHSGTERVGVRSYQCG